MPSRQKDEPEVSVHAVDLALDTGDYKWRNYRDLKAFDARRAYYSSQLDEAFLLEDSNLDEEVQRVFEQTQWMPEGGDQADNAVAIPRAVDRGGGAPGGCVDAVPTRVGLGGAQPLRHRHGHAAHHQLVDVVWVCRGRWHAQDLVSEG